METVDLPSIVANGMSTKLLPQMMNSLDSSKCVQNMEQTWAYAEQIL